jgi:4-hydroxy-2-oxoheptanedioate aldolase
MASTACFIGPNDLSASFGHIGNWGHPEVQDAIEDAAKKIKKTGKARRHPHAERGRSEEIHPVGLHLRCVGADLGLLAKNADALAKRFKS